MTRVCRAQAPTTACRSTIDYKELRAVAEKAARAGAAVVRDALDSPPNITFKGATDLVTDTDKAAEEACLAVVRAAYPEHAVLGEEGGVTGDPATGYLWCIDPLDGTTNFAHGYPAFACSVGVMRHSTPVAACVVEFGGGRTAWTTREFSAHRNGGATCNGEPICVSRTSDLTRSLLVTGFGCGCSGAEWTVGVRMVLGGVVACVDRSVKEWCRHD